MVQHEHAQFAEDIEFPLTVMWWHSHSLIGADTDLGTGQIHATWDARSCDTNAAEPPWRRA